MVPPRYALLVHLASNRFSHVYGQVWRQASAVEAQRLILAGTTSFAGLITVLLTRNYGSSVAPSMVPMSVVILGAGAATGFCGAFRFRSRLFPGRRRPEQRPTGLRVVVVGAGKAGGSMIREMLRDP